MKKVTESEYSNKYLIKFINDFVEEYNLNLQSYKQINYRESINDINNEKNNENENGYSDTMNYLIKKNILNKLKKNINKINDDFFNDALFLESYKDISVLKIFKSYNLKKLKNKIDEDHLFNMYLLFSILYPFYLAKYGFNLNDNKKIFIGPFIKKNKETLQIYTEMNKTAMLSFGIETGYYEEIIENNNNNNNINNNNKINGGASFIAKQGINLLMSQIKKIPDGEKFIEETKTKILNVIKDDNLQQLINESKELATDKSKESIEQIKELINEISDDNKSIEDIVGILITNRTKLFKYITDIKNNESDNQELLKKIDEIKSFLENKIKPLSDEIMNDGKNFISSAGVNLNKNSSSDESSLGVNLNKNTSSEKSNNLSSSDKNKNIKSQDLPNNNSSKPTNVNEYKELKKKKKE